MTLTEVVVALAIAVGLVGILVPILPGLRAGPGGDPGLGRRGGRQHRVARLRRRRHAPRDRHGREVRRPRPPARSCSGIPASTQWVGAAVRAWWASSWSRSSGSSSASSLGVYVAERRRLGAKAAWPSTKAALRAVGLSILIELAAATLAACVWVVGVVVT